MASKLMEGECHLQRAMEESDETQGSCVMNFYLETSPQVNELLAQGELDPYCQGENDEKNMYLCI